MEDKGLQSPQTFLVNNFSNLEPPRTFGTIGNATADKMTAKVVEKLGPFT